MRAVIETIIATCLSAEDKLNELDAKVGDGDTGRTFTGAARTVQSKVDALPMANRAHLFAILFANASTAYKTNPNWTAALTAGQDMSAAATAARIGTDGAAKIISANAGRSAYLEERSLDGYADAGVQAIAMMFEALAAR